MYIGALSVSVTLTVKDPTGTDVNVDANFSQREYQIHFQPLTDAEYQTALFFVHSEALSCPVWVLDVRCHWSVLFCPIESVSSPGC